MPQREPTRCAEERRVVVVGEKVEDARASAWAQRHPLRRLTTERGGVVQLRHVEQPVAGGKACRTPPLTSEMPLQQWRWCVGKEMGRVTRGQNGQCRRCRGKEMGRVTSLGTTGSIEGE